MMFERFQNLFKYESKIYVMLLNILQKNTILLYAGL